MLHSRMVQLTLAAATALLVSQGALADTDAPKPCKADVKKLCPKVKSGHGAILVCLEKNSAKVSQACNASLTDKAQAIQSACKPDLDKFCAQVEHGEGRLIQCLAQHEPEMTDDCKAFWTKAKSAKGKAK